MKKQQVVVIVGPTASGKTTLSIKLAERLNGEIISADSRQVYRGLDLGTGKVTQEEMQGVPHHLLDIADPKETYTASDFIQDGGIALQQILERQHLPIIVGGTFFYIDALLGKFVLPEAPPNPLLRRELEILSPEALHNRLKEKDARYAEIVDKDNPRRLIRAIEIVEALGHMPTMASELKYDVLTLGINPDKGILHTKIHERLLARLEAGMMDEVRELLAAGVTYERMQDLGLEYRYISQHLQGKINYETMCTELETKIRHYAKRQMTWLKRDETIVWVDPANLGDVEKKVREFLG